MFDWYRFWKTVDLEDSEFVFDCLLYPENGRFGRFGRPAEPSAPKGRRFGRLWIDSRFHLQNSENEATVLALLRVIGSFTLCCQTLDSSSYSLTGNSIFARINLKPAAFKNFVFDHR